jgi:hypothetical protein
MESIGVDYFSDGRLMLVVHIITDSSNVRVGKNKITWVPTEKIIKLLYETYHSINEYNQLKKTSRFVE